MSNSEAEQNALTYLRQASTVRIRSQQILRMARAQKLPHFELNEDALDDAAQVVAQMTRKQYPDLNVPYHSRWRHFDVGDIDRVHPLRTLQDSTEKGRCLTELVITSVLLDAGAGGTWAYMEAESGRMFSRSEGLAVASWHMYNNGIFSNDTNLPHRVDGNVLATLDHQTLGHAFQHSSSNPLIGLEGRATLLNELGRSLTRQPKYFGSDARLGHFFDHLLTLAVDGNVSAPVILQAVLSAFGDIWPGRITLAGVNLGDVWRHSALQTNDLTSGLIPFHKLSQWLTYSLLEPLELAGIKVTDIDGLTGLPEYRNGGLFIDSGVIKPRYKDILTASFRPDDEVIVEWRALTVALLDEIAPRVRTCLGVSAQDFPLAKVLQGGTWSAGRAYAKEKRAGGVPPITIISDGTVF